MSLPFRLRPTDAWVRALLAPALIFIACGIDRNYQTDLWHHLARGRLIATEGHIPNTDRFTYTVPNKSFQDVNWLSQLLFYRIEQIGGLNLLQAVNGLLLAATMAVLVWMCRRASGSLLVAAGVSIFVLLGLWQLFLLIRPQTFSLLLFVLLYAVLETAERRPWLLAVAPCLLAVWVNMHGGFPIGLVLIGCYLLAAFIEGTWRDGRRVLRDRWVWALAACLLAAALATLLNPYGWRVYQYVVLTSGTAKARKIDEWLPPGLDMLTGQVWLASLLGMLVLVLFAVRGKRPTVRQVCLVLCFLPPACGSVRLVAWWLLVVAPVAAALLAANLPRQRLDKLDESRPGVGAALTCAALVAAMVLSLPWLERWNPLLRYVRTTHRLEYDLDDMADRMREEGPGRVFTRFEWSEYLTWRLGPDFPVFMDGRIEIFPDKVWDEYTAVTSGQDDWQHILDEYHVRYLLIDAGAYHGRLRPLVEESQRWQRLQQAGPVTLYRRIDRLAASLWRTRGERAMLTSVTAGEHCRPEPDCDGRLR